MATKMLLAVSKKRSHEIAVRRNDIFPRRLTTTVNFNLKRFTMIKGDRFYKVALFLAVTLFSAGISVGSAETFEYNLSPDWNLVSLPLEPLDASVTSLFPDAISAFGFSDGYFAVSELTPCNSCHYQIDFP